MNQQLQEIYRQLSQTNPLSTEYAQLKQEFVETKKLAEKYLAAQFAMQVVTTIATLGMFWLAVSNSRRSK
jgi:hypothetical protein